MKISEFFGKRVMSTAGREGYVISVNAAEGKLLCLVCADENEREFKVDLKNVISHGSTIVFEDRESAINASSPLRLGRAGFDETGNYLGKVEDFCFSGDKLTSAKIGNKNYPAEGLIFGDVVIVKKMRRLKGDVKKDGRIMFKKGAYVTDELLDEAAAEGEYVQTKLKSI